MASLVALDAKEHRNLKVNSSKVEEVGADLHMVPVVVSEFTKLIVNYPILFTKNADTGQFSCIGLMGFEQGENLFWQEREFKTVYVPLNITRHPFYLGKDDNSDDDYVICVNRDSDLLSQTQGESIFNNDGSATSILRAAQEDLTQLVEGERQTQDFIESLSSLGLIVPLSLDITLESGEKKTINGLYSIDEEKMENLSAEQLVSLNRNGFLQAAYTQIASLSHIYSLISLKNERDANNPWFQ